MNNKKNKNHEQHKKNCKQVELDMFINLQVYFGILISKAKV